MSTSTSMTIRCADRVPLAVIALAILIAGEILAGASPVARRDVYGYDALAWALLANDRADEARVQMAEALALGTRDAKLLYHAGMIEAALGNDAAARNYLEDALATDPSFDPLAVHTARTTVRELD